MDDVYPMSALMIAELRARAEANEWLSIEISSRDMLSLLLRLDEAEKAPEDGHAESASIHSLTVTISFLRKSALEHEKHHASMVHHIKQLRDRNELLQARLDQAQAVIAKGQAARLK